MGPDQVIPRSAGRGPRSARLASVTSRGRWLKGIVRGYRRLVPGGQEPDQHEGSLRSIEDVDTSSPSTFVDREPPGWSDHQRFRRKVDAAIERGDPPGVSLGDAILMIDARIAADRG